MAIKPRIEETNPKPENPSLRIANPPIIAPITPPRPLEAALRDIIEPLNVVSWSNPKVLTVERRSPVMNAPTSENANAMFSESPPEK